MHATRCNRNRPFQAIRWAGRISAALMIGFVAMFFIGEGTPNPLQQPLDVNLQLASLVVMLVGLGLGWIRPLCGAIVTFGGLVAFCVVQLISQHNLPGPAFATFTVPILLYLAAWIGEQWERTESVKRMT